MNTCPVYRQCSGHAYRGVYPGPMGAVMGPLLAGKEGFAGMADLARASTLCGACRDVCPVDIPIPDLLARLRARSVEENVVPARAGVPPIGGYEFLTLHPRLWRTVMRLGRAIGWLPLHRLPFASARAWFGSRTLPRWRGARFRDWLRRGRRERTNAR
jgi:L-lactate dehydrogenase complex protein LldF